MPKVAQYQPDQVQTQVAQQPTASAAGGTAYLESSSQLVNSAAKLAGAAAQMRQRIDTTSAEDALVQFERDKNSLFFDPQSGYFNQQGRNAFDAAKTTVKALDDLKERHSKALNGNAKNLFDKTVDAHITKGRADISRHASRGFQAWEVATLSAQAENSLENASLYWNQPDQLRLQKALGRQAIVDAAELEGIGAEATAEKLQTFESSFAEATVESATMSSAKDGQEALEKYSDSLEGPDKARLTKAIEAQAAREKTQADAQQAILTGTRLADTYEDRESIRDEVNKIKDPELRKKTMTEAMRQFNLKRQADNEAQADAFERAESHIVEGGSAQTFQAEDPEGWDRLSAKQKKQIESGKAVITDWNVFSELMTMPREELAEVNPVEHFNKLAPAERSKLIAAVKSANGTGSTRERIDHQQGRTRTSQTTAAVEQILGKKSKWNKEKRRKANAFYSLLDQEVAFRESQQDGALTSEQFTQVLSDLTRKVTIERSILGVDLLYPDAEQDLSDMDPGEVEVLSQFLRDNGVPVTVENLLEARRQAQ